MGLPTAGADPGRRSGLRPRHPRRVRSRSFAGKAVGGVAPTYGNGALPESRRGHSAAGEGPNPAGRHTRALHMWPQPATIDRKSVVEGKSVSVRVDLGGRRILKKKKPNKQNNIAQNPK